MLAPLLDNSPGYFSDVTWLQTGVCVGVRNTYEVSSFLLDLRRVKWLARIQYNDMQPLDSCKFYLK